MGLGGLFGEGVVGIELGYDSGGFLMGFCMGFLG